MPGGAIAIISAVASGGFAAAAGTTVFGLSVAASAFVIGGASLALGLVSAALAPKPATPDFSGFASAASDRTQTLRSPVAPRRRIYGEIVSGATLTFYEQTQNRKYHHLVLTICDGEIDGFGTVFINDEAVNPEDIDAGGMVTAGRFANLVRLKFHSGAADQAADSDLIAEIDALDAHFRGRGVAYVYARVEWNRAKMPNGLPNFRFTVRGQKIADPRTGSTVWTDNAALAWRHYVLDDFLGLAVHGASVSDIDATAFTAAANLADEIVDTVEKETTVEAVDVSGDALGLADERAPIFTGDRVTIASDGSLPGGLSGGSDYYAIVTHHARRNADSRAQVQLASSLSNARARTPVSISSAGSGAITLTKDGEPRYTASGLTKADEQPAQVIENLLSAMLGSAVYTGGAWALLPATYRTPAVSFDENDLRGPISVRTRQGRRQRYNAVKGTFASHINDGEPSEYPVITSSSAATADGGDRIFDRFDTPFTSRPSTAQRLAGMRLKRFRQEAVFEADWSLKALQVRVGDVVQVTNARRSWSSKLFEVVEWRLKPVDGDGGPALAVAMTLRETASTAYDWDAATEENDVAPAPRLGTRPSTDLTAPGVPAAVESLYSTKDGGGVKAKVTLSIDAVDDAFVDGYLFEAKLSNESAWSLVARTTATSVDVLDVAPGVYDYRVRSFSDLGAQSDPATRSGFEVQGLSARPADIEGLTISAIGGVAVLRWTQSPDLDVRQGGKIVIRHAAATTGATWQNSGSIGDAVTGDQTVALLPLKAGSYLVKAEDSSGLQSETPASVTTKQATAIAYTAADSLTEDSAFAGAKTNCFVEGGVLSLTGADSVDDWGAVDDVADWDYEGGAASSGTYDFASNFDFGSVGRYRLTSSITLAVENVLDLIDGRTDPIDAWQDFDGDTAASADAVVYVRHTDDDPAGSPAWSAWERLDSAEFEARAFEFQLRLTSDDPAYTVNVSALSIAADQVA